MARDDVPPTIPCDIAPTEAPPSGQTLPDAMGIGDAPHTAAAATLPFRQPAELFDEGPLGSGGMGEVRRVRDPVLGRSMVLKCIQPALADDPISRARFEAEARCTARLQHPGIVPVHALGALPDGRLAYTMQEVRGSSLERPLQAHHQRLPSAWPLRRLLEAVRRVCETVGFAHSRGVVHRDLKPANIMVGEHGEITVVDWGIATAHAESARSEGAAAAVVPGGRTRVGHSLGTPGYMPPEQWTDAPVGPPADVYALGVILTQVLSGEHPTTGSTGRARLLGALHDATHHPEPLRAIAITALGEAPSDRFADGTTMARALGDWLDGAQRRDRALAEVGAARVLLPQVESLREQAAVRHGEAEVLLAQIPPYAPEADKLPGWEQRADAEALERQAEGEEIRARQHLHAALRIDDALPEAHVELLALHRADHAAAEASRDRRAEAMAQAALRRHLEALPPAHPARSEIETYLEGTATLTLHTEPPGATVVAHGYHPHHGRRVAGPAIELGTTPLDAVPLAMGSYLLRLTHPSTADVRYPVHLPRCGRWSGTPPGSDAPAPVPLPPPDELSDDACYVPAGWFHAGGDPDAPDGTAAQQLWCEGFLIQRHPATNADWLRFLDDLVDQGRTTDALMAVPRQRGARFDQPGEMIYQQDDAGHFHLVADDDGHAWTPDLPVVMIDWTGARLYAEWLAERTGKPWRLPRELEWEKAARGVDGRAFPWGDRLDPAWACMRDSHAAVRMPVPPRGDRFAVDQSPYGVRGLGGNTHDWCADRYRKGGPLVDGQRVVAGPDPAPPGAEGVERALRGGGWAVAPNVCRAAKRDRFLEGVRLGVLGVRLVRSWPDR